MNTPREQYHRREPGLHRARAMMLLCMMILLLPAAGCATTIIPPNDPMDPMRVFIIDYGRHSSLVLPRKDEDTIVEYAYGDWSWFALDRSDWPNLFPTLLWPTRGALGRWEWDLPPDRDTICSSVLCEDVLELTVASADADALLVRLDSEYERHIDTLYLQPRYRLRFVHHDAKYHAMHNCNHVLAEWLHDLGCRTRGFAMFSDFRLPR